jgi:hypothetical protein
VGGGAMLGGPGHGLLFVCTGPDTDEDAALLLVFLRDLFNENLKDLNDLRIEHDVVCMEKIFEL